jgi:hypothetical protein
MGFFGKMWRGEVSLPTMYWIFGVVVYMMFELFETATASMSPTAAAAGHYLKLGYFAFLTVGTWRSSFRHTGSRLFIVFVQLSLLAAWVGILMDVFLPDISLF